MKIGIITDSIRDQLTGIGFYTKGVVTTLSRLDKKNGYFFLDYLRTKFNQRRFIAINNPFRFFKTYLWQNYLPTRTSNLDFDLIFNFTAVPHLIPFKQKEIFFVYDISWYLYPKHHPTSRVLFYKSFFRTTLKKSYLIVTDSNHTKEDLIKIFDVPKEKIFVIYPSLSREKIQEKKPNFNINTPYIFFVGTLEPRKNIESIIEAFNFLKVKNKILHKLIITGKRGWYFSSIFKLVKKLNLEDQVIFTGYVTDEEKKYLYKHATFLIWPSFYEGFGIPVLEAMSYGCAVITSNTSSLPEVIGDAGIQVNPYNLGDIIKAMDSLLSNNKLRQKFVKIGFKQSKKIDNKKQISEFIEYLNKESIN